MYDVWVEVVCFTCICTSNALHEFFAQAHCLQVGGVELAMSLVGHFNEACRFVRALMNAPCCSPSAIEHLRETQIANLKSIRLTSQSKKPHSCSKHSVVHRHSNNGISKACLCMCRRHVGRTQVRLSHSHTLSRRALPGCSRTWRCITTSPRSTGLCSKTSNRLSGIASRSLPIVQSKSGCFSV